MDMRKWMILALAVVICFGLAACGEGEDIQIGGGSQQGSQQGSEDSSTGGLKENISDVTWTVMNIDSWMTITTTQYGTLSEMGAPSGTWELKGNTVTFTYSDDSITGRGTKTYQIKENNGVYFLVGDTQVYSSVSAEKTPVTKIEITMENWQDYFEFTTLTTVIKNTDMWGEVTENTKEITVLKLKEAYYRRLNQEVSSIAVRYASTSNSDEYQDKYMSWGYHAGRKETVNGGNGVNYDGIYWYGLGADNGESNDIGANTEVIRIQGVLALIDGI